MKRVSLVQLAPLLNWTTAAAPAPAPALLLLSVAFEIVHNNPTARQ